MSKIKVIIVPAGMAPRYAEIENNLETLQSIVGGYIECLTVTKDAVIICNEEGRLIGLPYNRRLFGVEFVGTVIIAGRKRDEFCDIPEALQGGDLDWIFGKEVEML